MSCNQNESKWLKVHQNDVHMNQNESKWFNLQFFLFHFVWTVLKEFWPCCWTKEVQEKHRPASAVPQCHEESEVHGTVFWQVDEFMAKWWAFFFPRCWTFFLTLRMVRFKIPFLFWFWMLLWFPTFYFSRTSACRGELTCGLLAWAVAGGLGAEAALFVGKQDLENFGPQCTEWPFIWRLKNWIWRIKFCDSGSFLMFSPGWVFVSPHLGILEMIYLKFAF